jgi:hypothetical protein
LGTPRPDTRQPKGDTMSEPTSRARAAAQLSARAREIQKTKPFEHGFSYALMLAERERDNPPFTTPPQTIGATDLTVLVSNALRAAARECDVEVWRELPTDTIAATIATALGITVTPDTTHA